MYFTTEQTSTIHEQTFAYLEISEVDHVLTITLNRPKKKNALNPVLVNELAYALTYAKSNGKVWAVVINANGDVFCAGADLKAFMGMTEEHNSTVPNAESEILIGELFNKLYKPCIVKVEGNVYAGGFLFLSGATYVVANEGIKLALPEVKRGLFPYQVMSSLMEVMPARKVLDWCIRGSNLTVEKAVDFGLVTHMTTPEEIDNVVNELLAEIKQNSPTAIRMGLEAYDKIKTTGTQEHHTYLREMLIKTVQTKDAQEGMMAFRQKRPAIWQGE